MAAFLASSPANAISGTYTNRILEHLPGLPLGAVGPTRTPTAPVGALQAHFEVSKDGAAVYHLPLSLPPATGALVPELALRYDSAAGDGPLGVGWRLVGESAIERCAPSLAVDGRVAPVDFSDDDALCLDGERLLLSAGQAWQPGAEYRPRRDDFSRVRILGSSKCPGALTFEVRRRDGLIDTYGCSDDAVLSSHLGVRRWARSSRADRFGNTIRYEYAYEHETLDDGWARVDHRLAAIHYGAHAQAPALPPTRSIVLDWAPRPDPRRGYFAGLPTRSSYRLAALRSLVDETLVRRWPLAYADDPDAPDEPDPASVTGRSRLVSVGECAADGVCRAPTTFEWILGEDGADDMPAEAWSFGGAPFPNGFDLQTYDPSLLGQVVLDGDGDGRSDLLAANGNGGLPASEDRGWEFWRTQPEAVTVTGKICSLNDDFPDPSECPEGIYSLIEGPRAGILSTSNPQFTGLDQPLFAIDYDADGSDEAIAPLGGSAMLFAITEFAIVEPGLEGVVEQHIDVGELQKPAYTYAAADFTGDGLSDILYCWGGELEIDDQSTWVGTWQLLVNEPGLGFDVAARVDTQVGCSARDALLILDHDGDGVASLLVIPRWSALTQDYLPVTKWGNYKALRPAPTWDSAALVDTGLPPDVAQRWRPSLTNGTLNVPDAGAPSHGSNLGIDRVLDVQGDGLPDLVRYQLQSGDDVDESSSIAAAVLPVDPPSQELGGLRLWINQGGRFVDGGWLTTGEAGDALFREFVSSAVLDLQGDGVADLMIPDSATGTWQQWRPLGDGTLVNAPLVDAPAWQNNASVPTRALAAMDVDGDGLHDPVYWSYELGGVWDIWRRRGEQPDRVARIRDGLGQVIELEYAAITDYERPELYEDGPQATCAWPFDCGRAPVVVVTRHRLDAGLGASLDDGAREFEHRYAGLRRDRLAQRSLGFHRHDQTEFVWRDGQRVALAKRSEYTGNLDYDPELAAAPTAGLTTMIFEQRRDPEDGRVRVSLATIVHDVLHTGPGRYHAADSQSVARTWELWDCAGFCGLSEVQDHDPLTSQVSTVFTRDALAHPTHERMSTAVEDGPSLVLDRRRVVEHDLERWLLDQVVDERLAGIHDSQVIERRWVHGYAAETGALLSELREPESEDSALFLHTTYEYDAFGNRVAVTSYDADAQARGGTIAYDERGLFPVKIQDALGHVSTLAWHEDLGVPHTLVTIDGQRQVFDYDGFGRLTGARTFSQWFARGDDLSIHYLPALDPAAGGLQILAKVSGHGELTRAFDRLGRETEARWLGADGEPRRQWQRWDGEGQLVERSLAHRLDGPELGSERWRHDAFGRVIEHTLAEGSVERWTHAGLAVEHVGFEGRRRQIRRDGAGRVVETISAPGTADEERLCLDYAHFSWLVAARPSCVEDDPIGESTNTEATAGEAPALVKRYTYDRLGRLVSSHDPAEGLRDYAYDAWGGLIAALDGEDQLVTYAYDALGRQIRRSDDEGDSWWIWDAQLPGHLSSTKTPGGVADLYDYDSFGRLRRIEQWIDDDALALEIDYDAYSRPSALRYPEHPNLPQIRVENRYAADGSLSAVHLGDDPEALWSITEADEAGRITEERFANGLVSAREWDPALGQLIGLRTFDPNANTDTDPLQDLRYGWSPNQTLAWREDLRVGQREDFDYDGLLRLAHLEISGPDDHHHERWFAYDPLGNLVHASDVGDYDYDARGLLTWAGDQSLSWDQKGSLIHTKNADQERWLAYTSFAKPAKIAASTGETLRFEYDADQRRVLRVDELQNVQLRSFANIYERERDLDQGRERHRYLIHGRGRVVAQIEHELDSQQILSARTRYLHDDHQGSTDIVTDEQGELVQRLSFDAWGRDRDPDDWSAPEEFSVLAAVARGYTGHQSRADLGLVDMGGRLYDPQLGRMTSADPLIVDAYTAQGWNRFAYVQNDPLSQIDPSGFAPEPAGSDDSEGSGGTTVTASEIRANPFGGFEMTLTVTAQREGSSAGTSTDLGPSNDARAQAPNPSSNTSTPTEIGLGLFDGLANTGSAVVGGGVIAFLPPTIPFVVAAYWATNGNPSAAAREAIGRMLGSETLAATPDSLTYEGTRFSTELISAGLAGLAETAGQGVRAGLGRTLSACRGNCVRAGLEGIAAIGCFVPGTRVRTPEGSATIETLALGDQVLAGVWIDGELRLVPRVIEAISVREISEIIELRYLTETGERATLELTPDHPLFAPEYQAYLQAAALALGDQLLLEDGQLAVVEQIARREGEFEVFNLSVEDAHNYFAAPVGDGPAVLVHNGVCSDLAARLSANYRMGRAFEQAVLKQLGVAKNTTKVSGTALNGRVGNTIPDIMGAEVGEIKNRMVVSNTRQMQIQADVAKQLGVPFNVYVSPRTKHITNTLKQAVDRLGGKITRVTPETGELSEFIP
ncbi:hypothetical protein G6O69_04375 [Pseudenhygromyxa sp. WMMC2535]|uniref:RHS repeat-associated core domain-containing protein n=1 Tax=Pseudenhygromyxa sp. WMMC2535 TaxID=2712867 RepID=UPI001595D487|nr:RHS repeat-associated core domain-containing protein [Pseudenhygromyxa sp. WMMC2535]NVB37054.1 hypothetical protein [Pseudenhygromyxa sp. WMMC2535]